jgi:cysteinyl-tRNA synthetase
MAKASRHACLCGVSVDAPEKIAAFNDSKKYNCNVICGDVVSFLKSNEMYRDNVRFVKNISDIDGMFAAHLVQSAAYNDDGSFVLSSLEEAIEMMRYAEQIFVRYAQDVRKNMNRLQKKSKLLSERIKKNKT